MFGQTSSQLGQHCWQWEWCHRRRWPWMKEPGHSSQTCRPNSGPSFDSLHATLRWNPWSGRPSRLQLHPRCKWAPSWRTGDHWCWIWCLLSSHTSPCMSHPKRLSISTVSSFNHAKSAFSNLIYLSLCSCHNFPPFLKEEIVTTLMSWPCCGHFQLCIQFWIDSSSIAWFG